MRTARLGGRPGLQALVLLDIYADILPDLHSLTLI